MSRSRDTKAWARRSSFAHAASGRAGLGESWAATIVPATLWWLQVWGAFRHFLIPGAFLAIAVPLIVFLSLQRYFVRGLLAGSVKG